jgi:hypothetical protein
VAGHTVYAYNPSYSEGGHLKDHSPGQQGINVNPRAVQSITEARRPGAWLQGYLSGKRRAPSVWKEGEGKREREIW